MSVKFNKRKNRSLFGIGLEELNELYQQDPSEVPYIAQEIINFIKRHGLSSVKIFVDEGDNVTYELLRKLYNKDGSVKLEKYAKSILSIAQVLKAFLRELPDPILTNRFGSTFIKTQGNPDHLARFRNMKKLIQALPVTNRALLKAVIDLFRLLLHHRHKNKLTTNDLCTEFGPIFLGLNSNSNGNDILSSIEVLRTLIVQNLYLLGMAEEPSESEEIPIFTKKSKKLNSKGKAWMLYRRYSPCSEEPEDSNISISLIDSVVGQVINGSVHNILFEPQVRISYNYETKIPNHIKKYYVIDKLIESIVHPESSYENKNINRSISYAPTVSEDQKNPLFRRISTDNAEFRNDTPQGSKIGKSSIEHENVEDRPRGFSYGGKEGNIIFDENSSRRSDKDNEKNKKDEKSSQKEKTVEKKHSRMLRRKSTTFSKNIAI